MIVGPETKELIHAVLNVVKGGIVLPVPSWVGYVPLTKLLESVTSTVHPDSLGFTGAGSNRCRERRSLEDFGDIRAIPVAQGT